MGKGWSQLQNRDELGTLKVGDVLESVLQRRRRQEAKGGGSHSGPWAGISIPSPV